MPRYLAISLFLLCAFVMLDARATAQAVPQVESETPAERDAAAGDAPPVVVETPGEMIRKLDFDSSELESAKLDVLWVRNWFLASGGAQMLGWVLLGAGISQCRWVDGVEVCPRAADNVGVAGAAIVVLSGVPLLVNGIMYGVRAKQRKELERRSLRELTEGGRYAPPISFDEYRLADTQDRIRRARNGLIASAAMFGAGWVFLGAAIRGCQTGADGQLDCTGAGYANLTIGLTFASSGAIGLLVSGIVLGARKKNERALRRSTRWPQGARFHWDPDSGAFVF